MAERKCLEQVIRSLFVHLKGGTDVAREDADAAGHIPRSQESRGLVKMTGIWTIVEIRANVSFEFRASSEVILSSMSF